ncbi:putative DNA-binding transcriptional regulator [Citrobacter koseri]|uniref:Putative DNA-binding transcriptional regulator n=1 Tax=Citrobacter koseri TaxID=545 RepID=A0A2X2VI37_CITKO|nr:putative DNA-binding transcriptional regulator [Citrobacter koseri]
MIHGISAHNSLPLRRAVSQSSVVKFAQKLGFKGFPALKLAISEALASNSKSSLYSGT